jgi:DNA replication and repair protein RecF
MHLKKLQLTDFRNYSNLNVEFDKNTVLILGENGRGKTNLLESIYYLSTGKSHRSSNQDELIKWGYDFALVRAHVDGRLIELEFRPGNNLKIKVDRVLCKKKSDFTNIIPAVLFTPDDLRIIKGGPSNRREFLDDILERTDPGYQALRLQYQKILNQRNSLLKSVDSISKVTQNTTFDVWNENLAKYGSKIIKKRYDLINSIKAFFSGYMARFFPEVTCSIQYIFSWERKNTTDDTESITIREPDIANSKPEEMKADEINRQFRQNLDENLQKEIIYKTTITGPHRDDLLVLFGARDIKAFGSQGQQRSAVICMKLCELHLLKKSLNINPVLLLDDVLSELDLQRESTVLKIVGNRFQTFITTSNFGYAEYVEKNHGLQMQKFIIKDNGASIT